VEHLLPQKKAALLTVKKPAHQVPLQLLILEGVLEALVLMALLLVVAAMAALVLSSSNGHNLYQPQQHLLQQANGKPLRA
jgi:hypothetical protein